MEVYLVRHTETICEKGICYGQSDVEIRNPYLSAFESIVGQLPAEAILYSSPLQRCTILSKYIQNVLGLTSVNIDDRLMEMNFGEWELKKWDNIPAEVLDPWMENFVTQIVPEGESFQMLHNRVTTFINDINTRASSLPLIIVTHAGVIRSFWCAIHNISLKDAFQKKIDFGEVLKISL
jgi:alpha-ribazole phosphatase